MKHADNRILIKVDLEQKNYTTFEDGTVIRLERGYNNLDGQYTNQVLGEVLSCDDIPVGADILFHFNSAHITNEIFDHELISDKENREGIKIYSIPYIECFLWKEKNSSTWNTIKNFVTALRVFKPYEGNLQGIEPKKLENIVYITSGDLKGQVVHTLKASDYCIIFRNDKGIDEKIIRLRHSENNDFDREEVIAIDHDLTKKVKSNKLLIGYTATDCKTLKQWEK